MDPAAGAGGNEACHYYPPTHPPTRCIPGGSQRLCTVTAASTGGGGNFAQGKFRPGTSSPGKNSATLEIRKAPSTIRPNDYKNTTRHAPYRDFKIATHHPHKEAPAPVLPDRQHQISCICARNGWLRRVRKCAWLFLEHTVPLQRCRSVEVCRQNFAGRKFRHLSERRKFPREILAWRNFPSPCTRCYSSCTIRTLYHSYPRHHPPNEPLFDHVLATSAALIPPLYCTGGCLSAISNTLARDATKWWPSHVPACCVRTPDGLGQTGLSIPHLFTSCFVGVSPNPSRETTAPRIAPRAHRVLIFGSCVTHSLADFQCGRDTAA